MQRHSQKFADRGKLYIETCKTKILGLSVKKRQGKVFCERKNGSFGTADS